MPASGTKLQRQCTVTEPYIVPFSLSAFSLKHQRPKTKLMDAIGMPHANMNNWVLQIGTAVPFSVAKALMIALEPDSIPLWLSEIQGKVERKKRPAFVSDGCADLARKFDAKCVGARIKMNDGAIMTIASAAAEQVKAEGIAAEQLRQRESDEALTAKLEEERIEATRRAMTKQSFQIPTPQGMVTIEMPALIPAGEREVYTGLLIRLHHRNMVLEREVAQHEMRATGLQGQVDNLKETLRRITNERAEERRMFEVADTKNAGTVAALATPRQSQPEDFNAARKAVERVPELVSLVSDMEKSIKSFPKGAALVS